MMLFDKISKMPEWKQHSVIAERYQDRKPGHESICEQHYYVEINT